MDIPAGKVAGVAVVGMDGGVSVGVTKSGEDAAVGVGLNVGAAAACTLGGVGNGNAGSSMGLGAFVRIQCSAKETSLGRVKSSLWMMRTGDDGAPSHIGCPLALAASPREK